MGAGRSAFTLISALVFLQVIATDEDGTGESSSVDLHISVIDINDETPEFTDTDTELVIPDHPAPGDVIGQ